MKVKEFIKQLEDCNPEAEIMHTNIKTSQAVVNIIDVNEKIIGNEN